MICAFGTRRANFQAAPNTLLDIIARNEKMPQLLFYQVTALDRQLPTVIHLTSHDLDLAWESYFLCGQNLVADSLLQSSRYWLETARPEY